MSKLDLSGIKDWKPEEQKEAKDLILEYLLSKIWIWEEKTK